MFGQKPFWWWFQLFIPSIHFKIQSVTNEVAPRHLAERHLAERLSVELSIIFAANKTVINNNYSSVAGVWLFKVIFNVKEHYYLVI
jgi:hypothetical protein